MRKLPWPLAAILVSMVAAACDSSTVTELAEAEVDSEDGLGAAASPPANALLGRVAFAGECASCHSSRDGFDLAFFSFPDSTIIRRAVAHVDTAAALDIVAHIRSLEVDGVARDAQSFQPGGFELTDDVAFAVALFGEDAWPADLTTSALAAVDPTQVPVALSFPSWSAEEDNLDWMPDRPLPDGILSFSEGAVGRALDMYYLTGTDQALAQAVLGLRTADRQDGPGAPCLVDDPVVFRPQECFEVRRWTASLVAQHMLRTGRVAPIDPLLHDSWWDVGNAARRSLQHGVPIENAEENWAMWMYLGWAFSPEKHASVYLATALTRMGLARHGTFHALRAQVARPAGRGDPYKDLATAARFAPTSWVMASARFAYTHLIHRLEAGDLPSATPFRQVREGMPESHLDLAWEGLEQARRILAQRVSTTQEAELMVLHERVEALLPAL